IAADEISSEEVGRETEKLRPGFAPLDLVEEISENTSLSYPTVFKIVTQLENTAAMVKNPPKFLAAACAVIRNLELDEMLRSLSYRPTGESLPLTVLEQTLETYFPVVPTPIRGVYDHVICDHNSVPEHDFAVAAEADSEVVCFLKLPPGYEIPTPIGMYNPDFGLVLKRRALKDGKETEYYFVIETKGTGDLEDQRKLTEAERMKIKCALKHFEALGIEAKLDYVPYKAPVKEYKAHFKDALPA
ncbi:MAG TPA: hypothetical protein P5138_11430, partial [Solirubrobacterales bacterium]|nr:hypothetical protein [Solirubrobacterales bacterium]